MFTLIRALLYGSVFVGLLFVFVPAEILSGAGIHRPDAGGAPQIAGMVLAVLGTALMFWCVFAFVFVGKGTPAPFDAPRRLVVRGPYRFVRNPMYVGAGFALGGAALFYQSIALLAYVAFLFLASHLFIVFYEEPSLRRTFGADYETYRRTVRRWWLTFPQGKR